MVEIIVSVVIEVAKCLAPSTERQLSYVRDYTSNFENLKTQIEQLGGEIMSMQHAVDHAKREGKEIEQKVQNWLATANKATIEAKKFVDDEATANNRCFKGLCPNLKTRHRLSKEAVRQLDAMVKLGEAGTFERISYSITPEDSLLMPNKDYEPFQSRMSTLNSILGALKNPDVNMLGIYGMGGIGKTTLAKEVAKIVESDKLFDQVVFSEVSESQDIRKIQGEIADKVGLKFDEESESGRARRLYDRLKKEKTILVILDNIWENLDLKAVGIPHGDDHKGCNVLLTARSLDTLSRKMDSQRNFLIGALGEEEAWSLFKKMAGNYVEGSELQWVARDVAKECAGLPVSIVTVARALRNKRLFEWNDALEQLRRPCSMNFKDVQPAAYKAIELSYNKLEGDELKNTFLLIGYTAIASIDDLLMYGMGLGLFQGVNKMEVARFRVQTLVSKLRASCMLLDHESKKENLFSIHDVVRDVAISIALAEQNVFSASNEQVDGYREWSDESAVKLYTSIVLRDIKANVLPDQVLECPQLKLFSIRADRESSSLTIPNNFLERMIQVRVLNLTYMKLLSLPSSLGLMSNLRTLSLYYCELADVSVIRDLKELEILRLRGSNIRQLPVEIGELTRLRLLDLRHCWNLQVIPRNVLSNLSLLEELYIGDHSFTGWEVEVQGHENASLDELKHLHNLTALELEINYGKPPPRGLFFEKLERCRIRIGKWVGNKKTNICRSLIVGLEDIISLEDALIVQLQRIEDLVLYELQERDLRHFVNELVRVGSSQLKHLRMQGSTRLDDEQFSQRLEELEDRKGLNEIILENDVNGFNTLFTEKVSVPKLETLYLHFINIERIWQNQVAAMSCGIQNLTHLTVHNCKNLRCLFPSSSVINSLVRLQHLQIRDCPALEEIIVMDQEESKKNIVMFPRLQSLEMQDLGKLTSFCIGDAHIIEFPSLKELRITGNPDQFMMNLKSTTRDLTKKRQEESTNDMQSCEIILKDNVNTSNILFIEKVSLPKLETLYLHSLNIERIWQNKVAAMSCGIQNLKHLTILSCKSLRWVISSSMVSCFVRLQHLEISECPALEEVIVVDDEKEGSKNNESTVTFPQLQSLVMKDLAQLTSFCTGEVHLIEFPSLIKLDIMRCPNQFMVKFKHHLTKKVFPNLEELKVDAKCIVTNKCLFSEDLLCNLKCLDVEFIEELTTVLSFDDLLQRFHTIKVLQIGGLLLKENVKNGMEVIIREAYKCCDLKHILNKESSSIMNNLVVLRVRECQHLINLVPSSTSFQNLTTLNVSYCNGLKNVLTSSIAKTLVRLTKMEIILCNVITEIVMVDDDVAAKDEVIAFSELKELILFHLESLTSFCSGNCGFKFPSLERLVVDGCPIMTIFSRGELSTPKLDRVRVDIFCNGRWIWEHDLNTTIKQLYLKKLDEFLGVPYLIFETGFQSLLAGVRSDDNSLKLAATTLFRKLLSIDRRRTIEEAIQSGIAPRFVEFLMREDYPQLQFEAAWVLSNIASGTSENTEVVIDHGPVPIFVKLLACPSDDVRKQAVWALGNVAGDSPRCRDLVLSQGALIPLLAELNEHSKLSMLRIATWTLSKFCRGKPQPPFDQVRPAIPALARLVLSNDKKVTTNACRALSYLSDGTNDKIQAVIEAGVCPRLVELLGHPSPSVLTPALRTIGNIVRGDDFQTQCIINCGALPYLLDLLIHNHEKSIKKEACWTISNITAGNGEQIQAVIDAGLIGPLVSLLQNAEFYIKKEAARAISNAAFGGTHEQIKYLVREGFVEPLCDLLQCPVPRIVTVCLKGLENILKVGEAENNMGTAIGDVNQYAQLVEEAEGLEKIKNLRSHDNTEISEMAVEILETFWFKRLEDNDGSLAAGDGTQPGFKDEEEDAQGSDN